MKGKVYYVFECGCLSLTATRLRIGPNKYKNCCPEHHCPVIAKQYTCENCGKLVELPPDVGGGTHKYCPECSIAIQLEKARNRTRANNGSYKAMGGGDTYHSTENEITLIRTFRKPTLRKYYYESIPARSKWGEIDVARVKQECEKLLGISA